jgi:hypothetical protein
LGLIAQKPAKFVERPPMQRGPLGLAKPYPLADSTQLLDGNTPSGAFGLGHDALADPMVDVGSEPPLLAATLSQQSSRRSGPLGLQSLLKRLLSSAVAIKSRGRYSITIAGGRDIDELGLTATPLPRCTR